MFTKLKIYLPIINRNYRVSDDEVDRLVRKHGRTREDVLLAVFALKAKLEESPEPYVKSVTKLKVLLNIYVENQ